MSAGWRRTRSQRAKRQGRGQSRGSVVAARGDERVEGRDLDSGGGRTGKREQQLAGGAGQFIVRGAAIVPAGEFVRRLTIVIVPLAMAFVIARAVVVRVAPVSMAASGVRRMQARRVGRVVAQVQRSQPTSTRSNERRRAEGEDGMHESAHRPPV